jgi:hypothetical protein
MYRRFGSQVTSPTNDRGSSRAKIPTSQFECMRRALEAYAAPDNKERR